MGWPPAAPTQLVIDTAGAVIDREDYVPGTVTLDGVTRVTEVRGRGNSTWGWAKKPYKLKLEEDAALVGSREYDEWVLLAGYADRSSLRTAAAFAIAAQTRLRWTPRYRFVEVVLNGQSQGLYMLTEQVEEGKGRVDLPDDGYLLEINQRYLRDDEPGFRTRRGTSVAFKDPDEVTKPQRREVRGAVSRFERVLYGPDFADPDTGYAAYVNVRKLIDWYLVEELFANQDSNFQSSVHFSWVPGKRFVFGPVWDFDLSAGTRWKASSQPDAWQTRVGRHWVARMLEDPAFSARVKSRWARLKPVARQVVSETPGRGGDAGPCCRGRLGPVARLGRPGVDPPRPRPPGRGRLPLGLADAADPVAEQQRGAARRHPAAHRGAGAHGVGAGAAAVSRHRGRGRVLDRAGRHRHRWRGLRRRHRTGDLRGRTDRALRPRPGPRRPGHRGTRDRAGHASPGPPATSWWAHRRPPRSSSTPTPDDDQRRLTAAASQGSGQGLNRHPPVPLDCCIITGARPRRWHPACPRPSQWPVSWLTTRWR